MTTLQRMNILFAHDFSKLRSIEAQESRSMRELQYSLQRRTIGQHCYLAEEVLEPDELAQLKQAFQLSILQWQVYKAKGIEGLTNMREETSYRRKEQKWMDRAPLFKAVPSCKISCFKKKNKR